MEPVNVVRVARFSRLSTFSSANNGLKFQRHTAAYVATGRTSRYAEIWMSGIEMAAGRR